jgi:phosphoglycolate phosphatase-like HAD superfamily hydrolase
MPNQKEGVRLQKLILWDVDLTLMRGGAAGRELYARAFRVATGRPMTAQADPAGRLDPDIWEETLRVNDLPADSCTFAHFALCLAATYGAGSALLREQGRVLPGAAEALAELAVRPEAVQTVLTGNIEPVARVKLASFGLDEFLDLEIGAYGSEAATRAELVDLARRRASAKYRVTFDGLATVLVGDSGHDVTAGREAGAAVVAVASGRTPFEDLQQLGPEHLFRDLTNTVGFIKAALKGTTSPEA